LVEVIAATPPNPEPAPEPVDAAHALPFQCSMSPPGFPALSSSPTAQTSFDELPATPDSWLLTDPNGGTATLLHDDPFHRSARGTLVEASIAVEPTAQTVLPAKAFAAFRMSIFLGLGVVSATNPPEQVSDGVRGDAPGEATARTGGAAEAPVIAKANTLPTKSDLRMAFPPVMGDDRHPAAESMVREHLPMQAPGGT
jgi:hypothetical protein